MSRRLQDKVPIITGAAGGIGSATCRRFIDHGALVAAVDIYPDAAAPEDKFWRVIRLDRSARS
jgi:NAD(P)-dependent dehydrogenase (short-subunit alcohol dehydrogenase family)